APGGGDHADGARPLAEGGPHRPQRREGPGAAERASLMDELPIRSGDDVVRVRQHVRNAAATSGLSLVDQTKLVTAASELARNTLIHGGGGGMHWHTVRNESRNGLRLGFSDHGPG